MTGQQTRPRWRERLVRRSSAQTVKPAGGSRSPAGFVMPESVEPLAAAERVVLLTRRGCHLCDDAIAVLEARLEVGQWRCLDVDAHDELRQKWTDHVPVTFVDGQLLAYWTLDGALLADALAGRAVPRPPVP